VPLERGDSSRRGLEGQSPVMVTTDPPAPAGSVTKAAGLGLW